MVKYVIAFALIAMVAFVEASPVPVVGLLGQTVGQATGTVEGVLGATAGLGAGIGLEAGVGLNANAAAQAVGSVSSQAAGAGQAAGAVPGVGGLGL